MKKLIIPALAIVLAFASSAFTTKKFANAFYEYQGPDFSQTEIQKVSNYVRVGAPCGGSDDVCGVTLTDKGPNSNPDGTEFNNIKAALWTAEQNHATSNPSISMQN